MRGSWFKKSFYITKEYNQLTPILVDYVFKYVLIIDACVYMFINTLEIAIGMSSFSDATYMHSQQMLLIWVPLTLVLILFAFLFRC